jgi:tRNA pseudouridine38-40 synthase
LVFLHPPDRVSTDFRRLKLLIAYDGRGFSGWQSQPAGDAVQDHLEKALATISGSDRIVVHGAGRTDAGVHALGQVAHIDWPATALPPVKLRAAVNAHLPSAARILRISRAAGDFHARFSARGKVYSYRIWNDPVMHPLQVGRSWHHAPAIDVAALRAAAALLEGTHDFAAFAANRGKPERDTVRTVRRIQVHRRGPLLTLRFEGTGFLYRMVRLLTGSMVRCAQGKADLSWLKELLTPGVGRKSSFAAPAEGLYLEKVLYRLPSTT